MEEETLHEVGFSEEEIPIALLFFNFYEYDEEAETWRMRENGEKSA